MQICQSSVTTLRRVIRVEIVCHRHFFGAAQASAQCLAAIAMNFGISYHAVAADFHFITSDPTNLSVATLPASHVERPPPFVKRIMVMMEHCLVLLFWQFHCRFGS